MQFDEWVTGFSISRTTIPTEIDGNRYGDLGGTQSPIPLAIRCLIPMNR